MSWPWWTLNTPVLQRGYPALTWRRPRRQVVVRCAISGCPCRRMIMRDIASMPSQCVVIKSVCPAHVGLTDLVAEEYFDRFGRELAWTGADPHPAVGPLTRWLNPAPVGGD